MFSLCHRCMWHVLRICPLLAERSVPCRLVYNASLILALRLSLWRSPLLGHRSWCERTVSRAYPWCNSVCRSNVITPFPSASFSVMVPTGSSPVKNIVGCAPGVMTGLGTCLLSPPMHTMLPPMMLSFL